MPTVFVISQDWTLRAGVRAELRERGVEALGMESCDQAAQALAAGAAPGAVVLDAGEGFPGDATASALARLARMAPLVAVVSRATPPPDLPKEARILQRPVRVEEVVQFVLSLLAGQVA
jgi:DNA-binding NarL/FixJ family response regulator